MSTDDTDTARDDERLHTLREVAMRVERLRLTNPMNGDGFNLAIAAVIAQLDAAAGSAEPSLYALDERRRLDAAFAERWGYRKTTAPENPAHRPTSTEEK